MVKHSSQRTFTRVFFVISVLLGSHLSLVLSIVAVSEVPQTKMDCSKLCGNTSITYPFYLKRCGNSGFGTSEFGLECDDNSTLTIKLNNAKYNVTNIDPDGIIIDPLQSSCSINLQQFTIQGMQNFAISTSNIIQLSNCENATNCPLNCNIPARDSNEQCKFNKTCCYPLADNGLWPRGESNFTLFSTMQCAGFTSWAISSTTPNYQAEFGLKLEWGIIGNCKKFQCHAKARCVPAKDVKGGIRCTCKYGYTGDGFVGGTGCARDCTRHGERQYDKDCEHEWDRTKIIILAAGLLGAAALVAASIVSLALLIRRRQSRKQWPGGDGNQLASLLHTRSEEFITEIFTYKTLDRATKGFADTQKCGQGACGTVYSGRLQDGRVVAVKRMHYNSSQGAHQLLNEINLLSTVRHKNLVQLLGCCVEAEDPILVYEFVPNGTLTEHLHRERGNGPLDWRTRCTIAADAAQALAHLHNNLQPPVYHRDVKSPNILLDSDFNCKVADFGLSRLAPFDSGTHISTTPQGTPGYVDPEYHQNFHLSDKSDVYSFGVVLVEIITAMRTVDFTRDKKEVSLAALAVAKITSGRLDDIVDPCLQVGLRPRVRTLVHRVAELAFRCLAYDKDARPTMSEVAEELMTVRKECEDIEDLVPAISGESPDKQALSPTSVQALWPSNSTTLSDSL